MATRNPLESAAQPARQSQLTSRLDIPQPRTQQGGVFSNLASLFSSGPSVEQNVATFKDAARKLIIERTTANPESTPEELFETFIRSPIYGAAVRSGIPNVENFAKFGASLAQNLGKAKKEPIKAKPGDVFLDPETFEKLGEVPKPIEPKTEVGKTRADLKAGLISRDEAVKRIRKLTERNAQIRSLPGGGSFNVRTGEVVVPGSVNVLEPNTGRESTVSISSLEDAQALAQRFESGELVRGQTTRQRQVEAPSSAVLDLAGLSPNTTREEAAAQGVNVDLPEKQQVELLDQRAGVEDMNANLTELQNFVAEEPGAVGMTGAIARFGTGIVAQLPQLSRLFGVEFDGTLLDPERYEGAFKQIGVQSGRVQSAMLGAAYAVAVSQRRRGGRLAQQDVERALTQLGSQDPRSMILQLQDLKERTSNSFTRRVESLVGGSGRPIEVPPAPSAIAGEGGEGALSTDSSAQDFQSASERAIGDFVLGLSDAEMDALSPEVLAIIDRKLGFDATQPEGR